jgi:hypothetical protein
MTTDDITGKPAQNLTIALGILDSYWDKLAKNMTPEQQALLNVELEKLGPRIEKSRDLAETSAEAAKFFNVFSEIEPLSFLSDLDDSQKRGASLNSPEEEIKIKILNYCVMLKEKMQHEL